MGGNEPGLLDYDGEKFDNEFDIIVKVIKKVLGEIKGQQFISYLIKKKSKIVKGMWPLLLKTSLERLENKKIFN